MRSPSNAQASYDAGRRSRREREEGENAWSRRERQQTDEGDNAWSRRERQQADDKDDKLKRSPLERVERCRYFERGYCARGQDCKFRHVKEESNVVAQARSSAAARMDSRSRKRQHAEEDPKRGEAVENTGGICVPFLLGKCSKPAEKCYSRHPSKPREILEQMRRTPCRHTPCRRADCVYLHPAEDGSDWVCSHCKFINAKHNQVCGGVGGKLGCNAPKPRTRPRKDLLVSARAAANRADDRKQYRDDERGSWSGGYSARDKQPAPTRERSRSRQRYEGDSLAKRRPDVRLQKSEPSRTHRPKDKMATRDSQQQDASSGDPEDVGAEEAAQGGSTRAEGYDHYEVEDGNGSEASQGTAANAEGAEQYEAEAGYESADSRHEVTRDAYSLEEDGEALPEEQEERYSHQSGELAADAGAVGKMRASTSKDEVDNVACSQAGSSAADSFITNLKELVQLHKDGLLDEDEFKAAKAKLLSMR